MTGKPTPKENDFQPSESNTPKTPEQGFKRKSFTTTSGARKIIKKKSESDIENDNHPALLPSSKISEPSTSKNMNSETTKAQKIENLRQDSDVSSAPDFDPDDSDFITKFNHKLPYSVEEDEMIVKYVLKKNNIFKVCSISLWKCLEFKKRNPPRTYQSLKNRFLRNIKPKLFTNFKHLINNLETAEQILTKFPELKRHKLDLSQFVKDDFEKVQLNLDSNQFEMNAKIKKTQTSDFEFNNFEPSPPPCQTPVRNSSRTVEFGKNLIKISVHWNKCMDSKVSFSSLLGLSERFQKLRKNSERIPCPTCGRFYRRPVSNDSESDAESDVLIPNSVETGKNPHSKTCSLVSNKNQKDITAEEGLLSLNNSDSQNLLISLEKSDKSEELSEESNLSPEDVNEKDEVKEIISFEEISFEKAKSEAEDKSTDTDSDIDLIYEHTVAKFHKLIDADEEKTLQRKCLNKDRDSIGLISNAEKNLESFFLETPMEMETPTLTNDYQTQVQENSTLKTQSQRITRSSALASNMMKMLAQKEMKNN